MKHSVSLWLCLLIKSALFFLGPISDKNTVLALFPAPGKLTLAAEFILWHVTALIREIWKDEVFHPSAIIQWADFSPLLLWALTRPYLPNRCHSLVCLVLILKLSFQGK